MSREQSSTGDYPPYSDGWAGYHVGLPKDARVIAPIMRDIHALHGDTSIDHTFVGIRVSDNFQYLLGLYHRLRESVQLHLDGTSSQTSDDACFPDAARWLLLLAYMTCECSAHYTAWKDRRDVITGPTLLLCATPEHLPRVSLDPHALSEVMQRCRQGAGGATRWNDAAEATLQSLQDAVQEEQTALDAIAQAWLPSHTDLLFDPAAVSSSLATRADGERQDTDAEDELLWREDARASRVAVEPPRPVLDLWRAVRWELHVTARYVWTMHKNFQLWHHRRELLQCALQRGGVYDDDHTSSLSASAANATFGLPDADVDASPLPNLSAAHGPHRWRSEAGFDAHLRRHHGIAFADINELSFTEEVLVELDRKNYHAWLHRSWFLSVFPFLLELPPTGELAAAVAQDKSDLRAGRALAPAPRRQQQKRCEDDEMDCVTDIEEEKDDDDDARAGTDRTSGIGARVSTAPHTPASTSLSKASSSSSSNDAEDEDASPSQCGMARMLHSRNPFARELTFTVRLISKDRWNNSVWCHRFTVIRDYLVEVLLARALGPASRSDVSKVPLVVHVDCALADSPAGSWLGTTNNRSSSSASRASVAEVIRHACFLEVHYALYTHAVCAPANEAAFTYACSMARLCQDALLRLARVPATTFSSSSSSCSSSLSFVVLSGACVSKKSALRHVNARPLTWSLYRASLHPLLSQLRALLADVVQCAVARTERALAGRMAAVRNAGAPPALTEEWMTCSERSEAESTNHAAGESAVTFYELDQLHQPLAAMYRILFVMLQQMWCDDDEDGKEALRAGVRAARPAAYYAQCGATQSLAELLDWVCLGEESWPLSWPDETEDTERGWEAGVEFFVNAEASALYLAKRLTMEDTIRYKYWRNEVMVVMSRAYT